MGIVPGAGPLFYREGAGSPRAKGTLPFDPYALGSSASFGLGSPAPNLKKDLKIWGAQSKRERGGARSISGVPGGARSK